MMKQKMIGSLVFLASAMAWDAHAQNAATIAVKWLCSPNNNRSSGVTMEAPAKGLARFFVGGAKLDVHINDKEIEELRLRSYNECVEKALPYFVKPPADEHPPAAPHPVSLVQKPTVQQPATKPPPPPAKIIIDNRYQILANGMEVKDLQTKLIWKRCEAGKTWNGNTCLGEDKDFNFDNAKKQIGNGWRLPKIEELKTLLTKDRVNNRLVNPKVFPNTNLIVWSNSKNTNNLNYNSGLNFYYGFNHDTVGGSYGVRLVHTE